MAEDEPKYVLVVATEILRVHAGRPEAITEEWVSRLQAGVSDDELREFCRLAELPRHDLKEWMVVGRPDPLRQSSEGLHVGVRVLIILGLVATLIELIWVRGTTIEVVGIILLFILVSVHLVRALLRKKSETDRE